MLANGSMDSKTNVLGVVVRRVQTAVYEELDALSPREIARDWAMQVTTPFGSNEGAFIYQIYTNQQNNERKVAIQSRFKYLTSEK